MSRTGAASNTNRAGVHNTINKAAPRVLSAPFQQQQQQQQHHHQQQQQQQQHHQQRNGRHTNNRAAATATTVATTVATTTAATAVAAVAAAAAAAAAAATDTTTFAPDLQTYVDYRNFPFKTLASDAEISFSEYCGPTPESNWVIPGTLLVGAYPASQDDEETYDLITSILKERVTTFVCLQQEYQDEGITEEMWRSGQALRPYFRDVKTVVRNKAMFPDLQGFDIVDVERLRFVHFPIRDCNITDDDRVLELAQSLVRSVSEGEVIYLHCWGGHGRTGTLVCIMMHLMYAVR